MFSILPNRLSQNAGVFGLGVVIKLHVVKPAVVAGLVEQFGVGADFFDVATFEHNDLVRGRTIWRTLYPLNRFFEQEGYVAAVKAATNMQGIAIGEPRPPILPLPDHKKAELGQRLEAAGLHGAAAPVGAH